MPLSPEGQPKEAELIAEVERLKQALAAARAAEAAKSDEIKKLHHDIGDLIDRIRRREPRPQS